MINFFSGWAKQIIIAVIITTIIEMLLPDNKNKKYIKIVMGIYILFSIISPIINKKELVSLEKVDLEGYTADTNVQAVNQESMDERLQQLYVEELENNIKTKVMQEGYNVKSCKVDAKLYGDEADKGIKKITLVVSKKNTETEVENQINISSVKKVKVEVGLSKYLEADENTDDTNIENKEIINLKEQLSKYYEIEASKISIHLK